MAQDGYNITKDMLTYNDDTITAIEDYNDAIIQAESNTQKLNNIKNEVSKIIKAAQDRRDDALLEKIKKDKCNTAYNKCINSVEENTNNQTTAFRFIQRANATVTGSCEAQYEECLATPVSAADKVAYLEKYKDCFDEEDISYYDDTDIIEDMGGDEETRCHDNIDNDLDGLIDEKDPDCKDNTVIPIYQCMTDPSSEYTTTDSNEVNSMTAAQDDACEELTDQDKCNSEYYYIDMGPGTGGEVVYKIFGCRWVGI